MLTYLSLLIPVTCLWCGWLWYSTTFVWEDIVQDIAFVSVKMGLVLVISIVYSILAMCIMGPDALLIKYAVSLIQSHGQKIKPVELFIGRLVTYKKIYLLPIELLVKYIKFDLLRIELQKLATKLYVQLIKRVLLSIKHWSFKLFIERWRFTLFIKLQDLIIKCCPFCLWFIFTIITSGMIGYIMIHCEDISSIDPNGWILLKNGLTLKDQEKIGLIQGIELDMSKCGQCPNAIEDLSQIMNSYESEYQSFHSIMKVCRWVEAISVKNCICNRFEKIHGKRFNNTFGIFYPLRGFLFYYHKKYKEALNDFDKSLEHDPNNIKTQVYRIFTYNMLGMHSDADLYIQRFIEKYQANSENAENQWILSKLTDFQEKIQVNYNKYKSQKGQDYRKFNNIQSQSFLNSWPTHLEFAKISHVAYCKDRLSLLPYWSFIDEHNDTDDTGYYGIAIQHNETKQIVIAHRGTNFDIKNVLLHTNFYLYTLTALEQFRVAQKFTEKFRQRINSTGILWHTGHSFGGAIAEFLVANETLFNQQTLSFAVTFDSPGIMEILEKHHHHSKIEKNLPKSNEFPVIGYLSVPNIINTMGTHIGLTLRLSPLPPFSKEYDILFQNIIDQVKKDFNQYKKNIDIIINHFLAQLHWHSMKTIIETFNLFSDMNGFSILTKPVIKWPLGTQQSIHFINLVDRHNLTTLDISKHLNNKKKVLNDFKRCNYHVINNDEYSLVALPAQLWNLKTQNFRKKFMPNKFPQKDIIIQLNSNCELSKFIDDDLLQIIFKILHWETDDLDSNIKMISINEQIYNISILNIYTLFSLVNLDNCILSFIDNGTCENKIDSFYDLYRRKTD
ncbi:unnamed protein product [Adineta ricciae]|uniref:Fungal lipase-like domain-containing protein n=1 Tax=Adineta ricciae TaxID=249248 RepID=A0A815K5R2_ADIRI|nr:unnamed protein product [Adineta ricciae]CAF1388894.1 unnamed protein product [Adineta ricciae]